MVLQREEGHILSYHVPKIAKFVKKINFWYFKVQVSKRTCTKNIKFLGFFEINRPIGSKPPKKFANIIADSEICKQYGDFDTLVGR